MWSLPQPVEDRLITSSLLSAIPGIRHGFGSADALVPPALQAQWDERPVKRQVHGTRIARVHGPRQEVGDADAFYTDAPGIPVSVITADCVPLLLVRRDGAMAAALHGGWRGLHAGIVGALWDELRGYGERPSDWVAAIGPTICAACYEVSAELAADFVRRYPELPVATVLPAPRRLDLRALTAHELACAGVADIEHVGGCTCCGRDASGALRYRSYRRGDRNSQQHAGVVLGM